MEKVNKEEVMKDGEKKKVEVKVIRKGVRKSFERDMESLFMVESMKERNMNLKRRMRKVKVVEKM